MTHIIIQKSESNRSLLLTHQMWLILFSIFFSKHCSPRKQPFLPSLGMWWTNVYPDFQNSSKKLSDLWIDSDWLRSNAGAASTHRNFENFGIAGYRENLRNWVLGTEQILEIRYRRYYRVPSKFYLCRPLV